MILVKRENVMYQISEDEKQKYISVGYSVIDEKTGKVIERPQFGNITPEEAEKKVEKATKKINAELEEANKEIAELKTKIAELEEAKK